MSSRTEINKLALSTADLALDTHKALDQQRRQLARLTAPPSSMPDIFARAQRLAAARVSPRRRQEELDRFDAQIARLEAQRSSLHEQLARLFNERDTAPAQHEQELAAWYAGGRDGLRPELPGPRIEREIAERQADIAACGLMLEETANAKAEFVERHRKRLVRDFEKARDDALTRTRVAITEFANARQELRDTASSVVWAKLYPHETLASEVPDALCAGLRKPIADRLPGYAGALIQIRDILELLTADAAIVSEATTRDQQAAIRGVRPDALDGSGLVWAQAEPEELQKQLRADKAAARRHYESEWGRPVDGW